MSVVYTNAVKIARMAAVVSQAGTTAVLEIGAASMASILATLSLNNPIAGAATGAGVLTLSGFPKTDSSADNTGTAGAARIRTASGGTDIITGMTVGLSSTAAPAWAASTAYTVGQYRTNGANQYRCTTAGTSASSGGPTGTGTGISDGTAVWAYYSPANADVQLDSLEITAGQTVTLNSATITHAA
jgi:hypothetical protein